MGNDYPGYKMRIRKAIIHYIAKAFGLLVHIDGLPYGSSRNLEPGETARKAH